MDVLVLLCAGLFLPLYPLSIVANLLLQGGGGHPEGTAVVTRRSRRVRVAVLIAFPLLGVALLGLANPPDIPSGSALYTAFATWGGVTSVLYAVRLLSARDGHIWISHLFSSALALVWVGAPYGAEPWLPAIGLAVSLLPLLFLLEELARRFGVARSGLYPGLAVRMPRFAHLFVLAVLIAIAVPFSPSFFAIAALALTGVGPHDVVALAPIGISWLLWTWAGVNLLNGLVWGSPRDDLAYVDLDTRRVARFSGGMLALGVLGIVLVEVAL